MRLIGHQKFENVRGKFYRTIVQVEMFARKRYLRRKCHSAIKAILYGQDFVSRYNNLFPGE